MAVIDLRDDPARNAALLSQIGAGIGGIAQGMMDEERLLEVATQEALRQNPQQLAFAYREATELGEEGAVDELAKMLNVSTEALSGVAELFPPSEQEIAERESRRQGVPEVEARARGATGTLQAERAEAFTERGLPSLEAMVQESQLHLQDDQIEVQTEAVERGREAIASLPEDERERFYYSQAYPQFLRDIQFREQMDLEERVLDIRQSAAQGGSVWEMEADRMSLRSAYLDQFKDLEEQLRTLEEEGAKEGEIEAIIRRYNNIADDWLRVFPESAVTIIDPLEALFGTNIKGVGRFRTIAPDELRATMAALRIANGNGTLEELRTTLEDNLPPAEAAEQWELVQSRLNKLETQAQKSGPERLFEWAIEGRGPSPAGAQPSDLGDFGPPGGIPR